MTFNIWYPAIIYPRHCDGIYYEYDELGDKWNWIGMGCLINASSTDTPAKLLKLELGCQLPLKSYYKLKCDVVKCLRDDNH